MAHLVELDENNVVINAVVIHNNELLIDGAENEQKGIDFCNSLFGGTWKQTSYNANFRYNYACNGYTYDANADAFIAPRPECGHTELFLNDNFKWNCQRCEINAN